MPETHVIEYEISEEQAAAAADAVLEAVSARPGAQMARSHLLRTALQTGLAIALLGAVAWVGPPPWLWFAPFLMCGLSVVLVLLLGLRSLVGGSGPWQRRRLDAALREAFRRLESPHVRWTVTDEELVVESGRDVREFRWDEVKDLFLTGTFWIMTMQDAPTMLLLADRIPDRTARFLLTRARDAGATIRVAGRPSPEEGTMG
jgi:hypothetical protein